MNFFKAFTTKWMDPDGLKLDLYSSEWCDPTRNAGYTAQREPSSQTRTSKIRNDKNKRCNYAFRWVF